MALRIIVGLACGAIYALSLSLAARHSNGIRLMSFSLIFSNLVFGLGLAIWPALIQQYGLLPLFAALGLMTIPLAIQALVGGDIEPVELAGTAEEPAGKMPRTPVLLLAAVCVLGNGGFAMLWAFAQVSGEVREFPIEQIGLVLAVATLASIVGSSMSAYIGWRKGVVLPLVIGLTIGIFAGSLVATSSSIAQYALGILIYGFATFFVVPYMISIGGMIENTGRAAMISGAAIYLSGALAPIIGGIIADTVSMPALEWTSSFLVLIAVVCAWVLHRTIKV
jgi:predicted MFS family arabinose efflux permease